MSKPSNADASDYQVLCSHPSLPLFAMGGKGIVDLHSFRSLTYLYTYNSQSRDYIDKIKFNNNGDLLMAHDDANSLFIWKLYRANSKQSAPIFTLNGKTKPSTDACFINEGTILASIFS